LDSLSIKYFLSLGNKLNIDYWLKIAAVASPLRGKLLRNDIFLNRPIRFNIDYWDGRFANRPYNNIGNSTSGQQSRKKREAYRVLRFTYGFLLSQE